ncbi:MAG: 2-amino-4-hydroxy-6-hydroxymethyldihydropteridine diphosphokinase [Gammaproteobacteria bacterium]|nr:2-amino-4-hydroxy-6-hydroxymethyldihydropteridine diphosphokinase [Gammaproteobacteria bacterium]
MPVEEVYIGIGGNIGDSITIVSEAIEHLRDLPNTELLRHSSLYRTEAVSDTPQEDYINAVALLGTRLEPLNLLFNLQSIEQAFYRRRDALQRWAPRTLDLDIILFASRVINDGHLTVPHAEMQNRLFVLQPMLEISGGIDIPGLGSLQQLADKAPRAKIEQL